MAVPDSGIISPQFPELFDTELCTDFGQISVFLCQALLNDLLSLFDKSDRILIIFVLLITGCPFLPERTIRFNL